MKKNEILNGKLQTLFPRDAVIMQLNVSPPPHTPTLRHLSNILN